MYLPLGAGVILPPWNFPLAILTGMTMAALVAGNTVVVKPSSDAGHRREVCRSIACRGILRAASPVTSGSVIGDLPWSISRRACFFHWVARCWPADQRTGMQAARPPGWASGGEMRHVVVVDREADLDNAVLAVQSAFVIRTEVPGMLARDCRRSGSHAFLDKLATRVKALTVGPARTGERPGSRHQRGRSKDHPELHRNRPGRRPADRAADLRRATAISPVTACASIPGHEFFKRRFLDRCWLYRERAISVTRSN